MKKLFLVAGLVIAFTANAQQRRNDVRNDKTEFHQSNNDFGGLRLNSDQQRKINALSKERLSQREYEMRIRKILSKDQYAKYTKSQHSDFKKDKKVAYNNGFRR